MSAKKNPACWYAILWTPHPEYQTKDWPDGIWTKMSCSKKYASFRRAMQALDALRPQAPSWGYRIVSCEPPTPMQVRTQLESWQHRAPLYSTHPVRVWPAF